MIECTVRHTQIRNSISHAHDCNFCQPLAIPRSIKKPFARRTADNIDTGGL